jgi:hypothetical protein
MSAASCIKSMSLSADAISSAIHLAMALTLPYNGNILPHTTDAV